MNTRVEKYVQNRWEDHSIIIKHASILRIIVMIGPIIMILTIGDNSIA
jgi:hypothetical protein